MTAAPSSAETRARVVDAARSWLGTPYHHQASIRGAGADCLGLVRGIWREVIGPEPETPPAYSPDWAEARGEERLLRAAMRHMRRIPNAEAEPGDMLLFRMVERGPAKHAAILADGGVEGGTVIHAYSGHSVCETRLTDAWVRRLAGAFSFPDRT
ncbi:MAG: NlpC/P60 family protein [Pseudomonadota bacterium]